MPSEKYKYKKIDEVAILQATFEQRPKRGKGAAGAKEPGEGAAPVPWP